MVLKNAVLANNQTLIADISKTIGNKGKHPLYQTFHIGKVKYFSGKALLLTGPDAEYNYFHWLTDALHEIKIAKDAGYTLGDFDWFFVSGLQCAFQRDSLSLLEIPQYKIQSLTDFPCVKSEKLVAT